MDKKIFISGSGGQGIKLMSFVLSKILSNFNYNVSLMFDYDAAMRGSTIDALLVYSDQIVESPSIEKADIFLKLSKNDENIEADNLICQKGVCKNDGIDFKGLAKREFGKKLVMNMIATGYLLKKLNLDLKKIDLEDILPDKNKKQNIEAIKYGYRIT
jgi:Pyruvate/2-oxoacid:ferredoxin oxidoreductase gamma subunit